ncbi:lipocalin family protein [Roseateles sp. P5_E7]
MRVSKVLVLVASALMASCATLPGQQQRELLVGHWQHKVAVFGEKRTSAWAFSADGSFLLTGYSETRDLRASHVPESGAWTLNGSTLELRYLPAAQADGTTPQGKTEIRHIVKLTAEEFVSTDDKFGIELAYSRANPQ